MTEEQQLESIKRVLRIFGRGCTNAGLNSSVQVAEDLNKVLEADVSQYDTFYNNHSMNPAACEECVSIAARQILKDLHA